MDYKALAEWATGQSTGASATCIARHMQGLKTDGSYPHDGGDFGRCEKLIEAVPEIRARLPEMATVNRYWAALVPEWEAIRSSPDQYAAIRDIVSKIEAKDLGHIQIGKGVSLRMGDIQ